MRCNKGLLIGASAIMLAGCTGIPLDQLEKAAQVTPTASVGQSASPCNDLQNLVDLDPNHQAKGIEQEGAPAPKPGFKFLIPAGVALGQQSGGVAAAEATHAAATAALPAQNVEDYQSFRKVMQDRLQNSDLPQSVRENPVTTTIFNILVKQFAEAQLARAEASGADVSGPRAEVNETSVSDVGALDLKDFTKVVTDSQFHPQILAPATAPTTATAPADAAKGSSGQKTPTDTQNTFARYFVDYYEGNFYDRLGNNVTKPSVSTTIPDSDISSALSVVIEYMVDLIDPTPVLGNMDFDPTSNQQPPHGIVYYPAKSPGGSNNEPEALKAGLANYKNIANNQCGVTTGNAIVLYDAANAAGDSVSAVSGLVSQSWGGIGISFGGFAKFSIGDNQTLGVIVKTAASRFASRAGLAASYWALDRIGASNVHAEGGSARAPLAMGATSVAAPATSASYFGFSPSRN